MNTAGLKKVLSELVSVNSVNPAYAGGVTEEGIQDYVRRFFESEGLETRTQSVLPGRENVIARLPGKSGSPQLIFEAHCDTAGTDGMVDAFRPHIRDGRLYGRGACDTKASLAAMMCAIADLKRSGTRPLCDIEMASVVDEEHACSGVYRLREGSKACAAVVGEPTQMRMVVASKGCVRARISVFGRAAHSSKPELGVNAITGMVDLLGEIERHSQQLASRQHWLVGSPTLNVGIIEGGTQVNIVPATCTIAFDRRLIPGEDPDVVAAEYREMLERFQVANPHLKVEMEMPMLKDWPLETPVDSNLVRCVGGILRDCNLDGAPCGVPFGSDASKLAQVGMDTIILGPGNIDKAHTSDEFVDVEQMERAFEVYRAIMTRFE